MILPPTNQLEIVTDPNIQTTGPTSHEEHSLHSKSEALLYDMQDNFY